MAEVDDDRVAPLVAATEDHGHQRRARRRNPQ